MIICFVMNNYWKAEVDKEAVYQLQVTTLAIVNLPTNKRIKEQNNLYSIINMSKGTCISTEIQKTLISSQPH